MLTCPVCRSRDIRRSARRSLREKFWSLIGRYPYRCYTCQTRFYALRVNHPNRGKSESSFPTLEEHIQRQEHIPEEND